MGTVYVGDGFVDFLNAVITVHKCVCRAMIWVVTIEPTELEVEFIRFLEV